jgi:hypothetical protein
VSCSSTPAAHVAGAPVETFRAKDPHDLIAAVDRALAKNVDVTAAAELADSMTWKRVFEAELSDLRRLCR